LSVVTLQFVNPQSRQSIAAGICAQTQLHAHTYLHTHTHTHTHTHATTDAHTHTRTHAHIQIQLHTNIHTLTLIRTRVCASGHTLPDMWLDNFLMVAQWRFPSFSAKTLSAIAWATATVGHTPSQEWLLGYEQQVSACTFMCLCVCVCERVWFVDVWVCRCGCGCVHVHMHMHVCCM